MAVRVVPPFDPAVYAHRGAVGLLVPGLGGTVTRAGALASLERGKVEHALFGGTPSGPVLVRPSAADGRLVTIFVALPPEGKTPNTRRYPIAIVGCGLHGLLTSTSTRIDGLVSIADIAPAARRGTCNLAPLGAKRVADAPATLNVLDRRIRAEHRARGWALAVVLITAGALGLLGPAGVAACGATVVASLVLSALGVEGFWPLILGLAGITVMLGLLGLLRRAVPLLVAALLVALLVVLVVDPSVNSLALLGARPDGGGRFYGVSNQLETLLLAPVLAAAAADGLAWLVLLGALAILTVGWSKAGADGGGLVVYAVALSVLALRLRGLRITIRRALLIAAGCAVLVLALVALDAALGGSSHVTHAVSTGPGSLLGDLGRRLHLSYLSVTESWQNGLKFAIGITILLAIAVFFRRGPTVDAMLAGLAVSFVVNDTPVDVAFLGALGCWALVWWESVDSRAMRRRSPVVLFGCLLAVLLLVGCGSRGTVKALPNTVIGTIKQPAAPAGADLFKSNGCSGCHTFTPAGATGKIGPDLDKLPQYAKRANQPLVKFVRQSIVAPNAYVEKGFPRGVMPSFASLSPTDLHALVRYLTTNSR